MDFKDFHSEKRIDLNQTGVYLIKLLNKPDWYYIGSASKHDKCKYRDIGFLQRWRNHISTLKRNKHFNPILQRSVNKYGLENLRFEIIEACHPSDCINIENKWIKYYLNKYNVYNINIANPSRLGQINSKQHRLNISKGRDKKKIYQFDFDGNLIKEWECYNQIIKDFPGGKSSIWRCIKNKQQTSYGFIWSYEKKFKYKPFNRSRSVLQFDIDNNFIKE